ncbi:MAG: hypothetical protein WB780_22545 [Candidatus Acidiferrales bacterium]
MSYASPNPVDHVPKRLGHQKASNYAKAGKELEYALKLNPNYTHAEDIKKVLAESPQEN